MASRRERCSGCGLQLLVPPETSTVRCSVCQAVTRVRPFDPWGQAIDLIVQAPGRFNNLVQTVYSNINTIAGGSANTYPAPGTYGTYGYNYYAEQPRPTLPPPSAHGRKRALLCGVSYNQQRNKLKGTTNDVKCMRYLLVEKLGFPSDCVLVLTEDEINPQRIPTKNNIRLAMRWLVQDCQPGDSLVFHFSGHGSREPDDNNDELDGFDEALCPLDHDTKGVILDDEINETIVRPLPHGAKLHAIIDACYSGTVLDLPFVCRMNREGYYIWEDQRCPAGGDKGTSGGLALCFSSCDDDQTSVSTSAFTGKEVMGAMTFSFIQAVENEPGLTYGRLLNAMRYTIREAKTGIRLNGPIASLVNKVFFNTELLQEPQLSSSEKFDIYTKQFIL